MSGASKTIVVETSMEKFYEVIKDVEKYPEFIPEMEGVDIKSMDEEEAVVEYKIKLMGVNLNYTLELEFNKPEGLKWSFVSANKFMKGNEGYWKLKKLEDNKIEAEYHIELKLGRLVPKKVEDTLASAGLSNLLKQFKERAESLA